MTASPTEGTKGSGAPVGVKLNPELLKAAHNMAYPEWKSDIVVQHLTDPVPVGVEFGLFNPEGSPADCYALQCALELQFKFYSEPSHSGDFKWERYYCAEYVGGIIREKSPALRALKCVSIESNIPLHIENGEGE